MTQPVYPNTGTLEKYAAESRLYNFVFAALTEFADLAQTITGTPVVSATPTGLTIGTPSVSGSTVQARISGGSAGVLYTVTCVIVTSGSSTLEISGTLQVI